MRKLQKHGTNLLLCETELQTKMIILYAFLFLYRVSCYLASQNRPLVDLSTGPLEGVQFETEFNGETRQWQEFRGIRYGQSPVRFEKPLPAKTHEKVYGKALNTDLRKFC